MVVSSCKRDYLESGQYFKDRLTTEKVFESKVYAEEWLAHVFEELKGEERQQVMQGLILRIMPNTNDPARNPSHAISPALHNALIVYRINIEEATGRFESHSG